MPVHEFDLAILLQNLDDDLFLAEALLFPEVSRFGDDPDRLQRAVIKNAARILEGMVKRNIKLAWTDRIVNHVVRLGFDSRFGARPLQRVIEKEIVTTLALHLNDNPHLHDTQVTLDFNTATTRVIVTSE